MVSIEHKNGKLFGVVKFPTGETSRLNISEFLILNEVDCNRFLHPIFCRFSLYNPNTCMAQISKLKWIGSAFNQFNIFELPNNYDSWQRLILLIHRFILTRKDSKASLKTRNNSIWVSVKKILENLMDDGIIPISIFIPRVRESLDNLDISQYKTLLIGDHDKEAVNNTVDKLLVSISLARTDAEYLDEFRENLAVKRNLLHDVLCDYFYKIRDNYKFGCILIQSVEWPTLKLQIETHLKICPKFKIQKHPANPVNSLANYLSVIRNKLNSIIIGQRRILKTETMWIPYSGSPNKLISKSYVKNLPANFIHLHKYGHLQCINWMLGNLFQMDVTFIIALLIMLNPKFTANSLMYARLYDKNGKKYIEINEDGSLSFSINKSRAKAMKTETLDDLSQEIIKLVIEMSEPVRSKLKKDNNPNASLLFLPVSPLTRTVTAVDESKSSSFLSGTHKSNKFQSTWLGTFYPCIIENGLGPKKISLSKIRNTEGVLEWFRTGSIKAVSRKLGNTQKTVLDHYIPKALLSAWNTRLIRRFQNLWLTVAAANEDYLLDVTDFNSIGDLHSFLINMLTDHPSTSSPLATELHKRFSRLLVDPNYGDNEEQSDATLSVSISRNGLAALYLYSNSVQLAGISNSIRSRVDPQTNLSPNNFIDLAEILSKCLPDHKDPKFREIHFSAVDLANQKSSTTRWIDIIFQKVNMYDA